MRTLHLFAGAGGGLLADLILGHTPVAAVEWDAYCCQVLRERAEDGWFPGLRVHEGDIRLFDPSEYAGRVDCIHAGFPCQDVSSAGNQAGVGEGTRSGLYREVLRIADVVRPRYLFLENVAAILSNGLGTVLGDMAARGYDSRWTCLRASDCGAPHQRDRWWLVGYSGRTTGERDAGGFPATQAQCGSSWQPDGDLSIRPEYASEGMADAECERGCGWHAEREDASDAWQSPGDSFVGYWDVESGVGRVVDGMADRARILKALGNGQVPLQAALAWRILTRTMET